MEALGSGGVRRFTDPAPILGGAGILQPVVEVEVLLVELEELRVGGSRREGSWVEMESPGPWFSSRFG